MKKQILIVDDDQRVLDALRRTLHDQSDDWAMTFVRHPETAWEQLLETAYDAVVTDVKMPGISGLDLLERIRQTDKTKDVPVVVFTGLERSRPEGKGPGSRGRRPVEQAGRGGAVDRPPAERAATEGLRGRPAGEERIADGEGSPAETSTWRNRG